MTEPHQEHLWKEPRYVSHHVVRVWSDHDCSKLLVVLYFGDDVLGAVEEERHTRVYLTGDRVGWVKGKLETTERPPLALAFLDVGQGDACLITTPCGKRILVDGGENQLAARYLARRYWHETVASSQVVFDAVVVTHGDADHIAGLSTLVLEASEEPREGKGIRFATRRLFHNGLVKRPTTADGKKRPELEMLGDARQVAPRQWMITGLVEDPSTVDDTEQNKHFKRWRTAIETLRGRHPLEVARVDHTRGHLFDFIDSLKVEVLGPRTETLEDGSQALPYFGAGPGGAPSSSKAINGHSVTLRLTFGHARILLTGDLTEESSEALARLHATKDLDLEAEVLKVPHHGSEDFSLDFLKAVRATVSIISAGDEDAMRDHLHPRANVVGALGRSGRGDTPLIFVTNLAAFDKYAGRAFPAVETAKGEWVPKTDEGTFYARERTVFGIIHVRTDGEQLLVARRGASLSRREEYAFQLSATAEPRSIPVTVL